ncbi:hypothetical protein B0H14DRAFT_2580137 [Mycena olivaceomarginata]|nr:hypothetical protein B0H14DRAFT_2580137 [Mycena olivaceomarginata]
MVVDARFAYIVCLSLFFLPSSPIFPCAFCPSAPAVAFLRLSGITLRLVTGLPLPFLGLVGVRSGTAHSPSARTTHCEVVGLGGFSNVLAIIKTSVFPLPVYDIKIFVPKLPRVTIKADLRHVLKRSELPLPLAFLQVKVFIRAVCSQTTCLVLVEVATSRTVALVSLVAERSGGYQELLSLPAWAQ